jgi:ribonuclease HI
MTTIKTRPEPHQHIPEQLQIQLLTSSHFQDDRALRAAYEDRTVEAFNGLVSPLESNLTAQLEASNLYASVTVHCIFYDFYRLNQCLANHVAMKEVSPYTVGQLGDIFANCNTQFLYTDGSQRVNLDAKVMRETKDKYPAYSSVIGINQATYLGNNHLTLYWFVDVAPLYLHRVYNLTNNQAELLAICLAGLTATQQPCWALDIFTRLNPNHIGEYYPGLEFGNYCAMCHINDVISSSPRKVYILSDSSYCVNAINSWMDGWQTTWNSDKKQKPKENLDLWKTLYSSLSTLKNYATIVHLKGHNGNLGNCLADISMEYYHAAKIRESQSESKVLPA